jgi:hypothetical protein
VPWFVVAGRDGFRRSRRRKPKNSSMNFSLLIRESVVSLVLQRV